MWAALGFWQERRPANRRTWYLGTMGTISGEPFCRAARFAAVVGACLTLAHCGSASKLTNKLDPKYGVSASPRVVQSGEPVPKGGGTFRVGRPYMVAGRM